MPRYTTNIEKLKEAIEYAGGIGTLATKAKISYQSIIDWKRGSKSPSQSSCERIEKATDGKIKASDLLPDYPWHEVR